MAKRTKTLFLLILAIFALTPTQIFAQPEKNGDKTLSPYFFVKTDDLELDQLPLKSTSVDVNVSGVIADVVVTQVYKNEGKKPLEAIYVFPASTRAAVYGMKMTIGERTITAKIKKREDARQEYAAAKNAGQSASLLEQHRPNVFQMNVANILPSDIIAVELRYTELLIPTDGVYEFVYPTVVGPRYSNQKADDAPPSETWIENPYLHEGEAPTSLLNINLNLNAGLPIQDITCSSHEVNIDYTGSNIAAIKLAPSEKQGGNRDFILKYRLAGGSIESGMLLYEGEEENYFLIMLQPPKRVKMSQIPPREYMFIVDVSGSMNGFPLGISKKLLKDLIGRLRPEDRFNVLLFAGSATVMSDKSLPATQENIRRAIKVIERQRGGGGTELLPALKKALSMPGTEEYSRNIIIATDGYVTVEEEAFDLIRNRLEDANMFTFGIGSSVNRHLIEGMARVGMGEPFIITRPEEAPGKAEKFRELIQTPVLTDIKLDYGKFDVFDVEPPTIPDVLADRPVIVFGKYRGKARGVITLKGITGDVPFKKSIDVATLKPLSNNSALRYLWARHRIAVLSDYNRLHKKDERIKEVTSLGLTYNLLTAYTSFIAVDSQKRLQNGQSTTIKQPLPLAMGVSDYAVGNGAFAARTKAGCYLAPSAADSFAEEKNQYLKEEEFECKKAHDVVKAEVLNTSLQKVIIELEDVIVTEGLSKQIVQKLLEKQLQSINDCYKNTSGGRAGLAEKVAVTLRIDPEGRVTKAEVDTNKIENRSLANGIISQLKKLTFPAPQEGKTVEVAITFVLKS